MAKITNTLLILVLLHVSHSTAAPGPAPAATTSTGLAAACKRTSDPNFCTTLLEPYASQFQDGNPMKMGNSAISATLSKSQEVRAYMVRQLTNPEVEDRELDILKECHDDATGSAGHLKRAAKEFDDAKKQRKDSVKEVAEEIELAIGDQVKCQTLLNKGGWDDEVAREAKQQIDEAIKACGVARAFIN